jgi:5-methylcytosine-specific restriction endonuclease McrA
MAAIGRTRKKAASTSSTKEKKQLELKPYNDGTWTEGRFNSFIKSTLRSGSQRWPPKYKALSAAKQGKRINQATGRLAEHYKCKACGNDFPASYVQVDHISPVINPSIGFTNWDDVIKGMFCEQDNFQILCKDCHRDKTNAEKQQALERTKKHLPEDTIKTTDDNQPSGRNPGRGSGSKRKPKQ